MRTILLILTIAACLGTALFATEWVLSIGRVENGSYVLIGGARAACHVAVVLGFVGGAVFTLIATRWSPAGSRSAAPESEPSSLS
jgi:hypothetical protein